MEAAEFPDIAVPWQRGLDGSTRNLPTFLVTFHESHIHYIYIYHYHYPYIYILHGSFTPFFFPSPAGVQELTMNNQDLKVVISVVTCLLFVQADDAVWRWLETWSSFLLERRVFCGLIDIDIDIVIM
jgi:hypothetical protein